MAKIIRPNLVNTVRSSQMSTVLRWGGVFVALLLAALLLLLAEWYLPAAGCMLAIPLLFPLAKKRVSVIRAGADGEAETLRLLRKLPPDWTVIPDAVIEYRDHRSQTDYILVAPTGILILEAKNVSGRVTGRAEDRELSQYKPARGGRPAEQKRMYNPLLQAKGHQTSGSRNVFTARDSQPLDQSVRRLLNGGERVDTEAVIAAIRQSFSK